MLRCVKQKLHEKHNDILCKIPRGEAEVVLKWLLVTFRTHFKMFATSELVHSTTLPIYSIIYAPEALQLFLKQMQAIKTLTLKANIDRLQIFA